jgi:thioesterase domain-containing protein
VIQEALVPMSDQPKADPMKPDPAGIAGMVNALFEARIPVIHRLGIRIVEVRDGLIVGAAPLAGNLNYQGSMYAGTLFGLGEALGAVVFAAHFDLSRFTATVKDVQIRFRRPALTDVRAEASLDASTVARLKREADDVGKAEFVLDAELTDTAGVVVATTHGTYQVRTL